MKFALLLILAIVAVSSVLGHLRHRSSATIDCSRPRLHCKSRILQKHARKKICLENDQKERRWATECESHKLQCDNSGTPWTVVQLSETECKSVVSTEIKAIDSDVCDKQCDMKIEKKSICLESLAGRHQLLKPCEADRLMCREPKKWNIVDVNLCDSNDVTVARDCTSDCVGYRGEEDVCVENHLGLRRRSNRCVADQLMCRETQWRVVDLSLCYQAEQVVLPSTEAKKPAKADKYNCNQPCLVDQLICLKSDGTTPRKMNACDAKLLICSQPTLNWMFLDLSYCRTYADVVKEKSKIKVDECQKDCPMLMVPAPVCMQNRKGVWRTSMSACEAEEFVCRDKANKWVVVGNYACPDWKFEWGK